jgi:hypothetical protein
VLLITEVGVWRDVEEEGVGDVLRGLSARALVWGDPHVGGSSPEVSLLTPYDHFPPVTFITLL